ncbi:hypothetical protein AVEN_255864-1 [Araneus ventricosus]|uniref:Uncharacterized protein n=1 Tax=Araneus ventricosus TaxID=182803 RepID=A0A4Y2ELS9_ARAVE|nr:hypothetical protein AVEN_255864-1 [Araneus ventricosus]
MAGDTLAQASVIRFRSSCNVGGGDAYTRCLMYPQRKKSNGFSPQLGQLQESTRPQKNYRRTNKGGECRFCCHWTLDARGKKSDFVYCLYALAGYNGMAFTPWVTCQEKKLQTYNAHSTQGHHPRHDAAA